MEACGKFLQWLLPPISSLYWLLASSLFLEVGQVLVQRKKNTPFFFTSYQLFSLIHSSYNLIADLLTKQAMICMIVRLILESKQSWTGQECKFVIVQLCKTISFGIWVIGGLLQFFLSDLWSFINRARKFTNK